ncbi:hypothetical protein GOBAR_DD29170 [Gossypium barbadense]|nr:hypothetical protein GOBAR_DD29170 [Gossypium barbadense]
MHKLSALHGALMTNLDIEVRRIPVAMLKVKMQQAARNNVLLAVPALLYAINNYLKFTIQVVLTGCTSEAVVGSTTWLGRGLSCVCAQSRESDARPSFDLTPSQKLKEALGGDFENNRIWSGKETGELTKDSIVAPQDTSEVIPCEKFESKELVDLPDKEVPQIVTHIPNVQPSKLSTQSKVSA